MKNLAKAVIKVMSEVKGMEKNSNVGSGRNSYNGTKDSDVKEVFNEALERNGLCILPTGIDETTELSRWEVEETWNGKKQIKQKQSVFTKVTTKYLLLHDSGESVELSGYGHGVDSQDKGAGKATTYALKNCLLYTFLTPVGKIDDTETNHSEEIVTPIKKPKLNEVQFDRFLQLDKEKIKAQRGNYTFTEEEKNIIEKTLKID
tara:strand:- start:2662 stop:3273 length:612 start_codon:yes stop_codon:yes gene_type:complete